METSDSKFGAHVFDLASKKKPQRTHTLFPKEQTHAHRFGEGAGLLSPIAPIKQAYAAWMPSEKINIDVGFFDTIFGAEVADEWNNANYTRGALYFLRQPFNHMGLRMGAELGEIVGFTAMVTNGGVYGGTPIDDNETPALSWQFGLSPDGHNSVRRRGLREGTRDVGLFFGGSHAASGL